jgi:DNA adenine methylase
MRISPLRYAGGKSKAVHILEKFVPWDETTICSPFFGGGSFELYCAANNIKVYGYDIFAPLVNFWQALLKNPNKLADLAASYRPLSKKRFYELREEQFITRSLFKSAAIFFVLNRTSFSGSTLSGGMATGGVRNNPRFTRSSIEKVRNFKIKNFTVNLLDFRKSIKKHKNSLLYLDPPYLNGSRLYGINGDLHASFDHKGLAEILHTRNVWILSYNDSKEVRKLYEGYTIIPVNWKYGMSQNKQSNEIVILSKDVYMRTRI